MIILAAARFLQSFHFLFLTQPNTILYSLKQEEHTLTPKASFHTQLQLSGSLDSMSVQFPNLTQTLTNICTDSCRPEAPHVYYVFYSTFETLEPFFLKYIFNLTL